MTGREILATIVGAAMMSWGFLLILLMPLAVMLGGYWFVGWFIAIAIGLLGGLPLLAWGLRRTEWNMG